MAMTLTIDCSCGTAYDAEFEPVDGRAPDRICCPQCGADATDFVNAQIAELAATAAETTPAPPAAALPTTCARHQDQPVEIFCFVCKKPMCAQCLKTFGFVCSPYCRQRATELGLNIPVYEGQESVVQQKAQSKGKWLAAGTTVAVLALFGAWLWYAVWGSKPSVIFSVKLAGSGHNTLARFLGPRQLLVADARRLILYDAVSGKEMWSKTLAMPATGWDVIGNDLWVQSLQGIWRMDKNTGQQKAEITVPGAIGQVNVSDRAVDIISSTSAAQRTLTHLESASGQRQIVEVALPVIEKPPLNAAALESATEDDTPSLEPAHTDLVPTGANVARLDVALVKANIVAYEAIKRTTESKLAGEVKVTETAVIAEELLNDMQRQRTGGIRKEDESEYQVTLHRWFAGDAPDWTGIVNGPPRLFPLKTLDLLVAGRTVQAFDKNNRKLWDAKLAYPISPRYFGQTGDEGSRTGPCLEAGATLYFFDQGVLTAFDRATGTVKWRIASVGISRLDLDDAGMLYVSTTSAAPESIQYSQQVHITDRVAPVIMKVAPATGQILWRIEKVGNRSYVSGKFLYFISASVSWVDSPTALTGSGRGQSMPVNFRIHRMNPRDGKELWEYYRPEEPVRLEFQNNLILLVNAGEIQVLRFLSF